MSQHDYDLADLAGAAFLADLNEMAEAIATLNAGPTEPADTFPNMLWADTTTNLLKRRNKDDDAWIIVGSLDEARVIARSSDTQLTVSDWGRTIVATGTWSQTFAAVATLPDGWYVDYKNEGSGVITHDPNSTEQIDGVTTLPFGPGQGGRIYSTGTALKTVGLNLPAASQTQMEAATSSAAAATPANLRFHPGVSKCWGFFDGTAGSPSLAASYNCTSLTDNGAGNWTITIADDFSSANWVGLAHAATATDAPADVGLGVVDKAAGSFRIDAEATGSGQQDYANVNFVCFGDQ